MYVSDSLNLLLRSLGTKVEARYADTLRPPIPEKTEEEIKQEADEIIERIRKKARGYT